MRFGMLARVAGALAATALIGAAVLSGASPATAETGYTTVSGSGSTWSQNAIAQWARNVHQYGLTINYSGVGSSAGRQQFGQGSVDFAVSEIPYGLRDTGTQNSDPPPARSYRYMPIVAGGTALMYNLSIGGERVTNLRLSGEVITKIFTGVITMWNDAEIREDNPQLALPARRIVPVVRSDGSGTSAQFSMWMSSEYGALWNDYCERVGRDTPCGQTSYYPTVDGMVAQSGSNNVAGYVAQAHNEGAITYVEYSYALNAGFPVVKVLNRSGYYVEPTPYAVAVGLLGAQIEDDDPESETYLTQNLTNVYRNADERAYPMSSYSYMIIPDEIEYGFNEDKGLTLGDFAYHFLCEGQNAAPSLGYSPLPINLVEAGFAQVREIPGARTAQLNVADCNNPTFSTDGSNTLAEIAPYPADCDKQGPVQCATGTGGAGPGGDEGGDEGGGGDASGATGADGGGAEGGTATGAEGGTAAGDGGAAESGAEGATSGDTAGAEGAADTGTDTGDGGAVDRAPVVDPDTGEIIAGADSGTDAGGDGDPNAANVPTVMAAASGWGLPQTLMLIAGLSLLVVIVAPPLVLRALRQHPGSTS
ncbi:phosphate ABC transporter substrate-binding protein PstS [Jiangella alkaliphila]|uniref:Phosphate transport system substrate-binding protein n=1 Tax=Jiangella alkaliphila TaxID=419479 RepID=A0A1H2KWZ9_9ACTN|nr:phosphate ABC transporter substrate-binding protein PstS [Jiangella alkaliphila]SDU73004.1 phosphate transport system substrate-binding protein [Jiangella alkaliphila]